MPPNKFVLAGIASVVLAILIAGCGSSGSSSETVSLETTAEANAACEEAPVKGGNLVYARQQETVSLNPNEGKNGNGDIFTVAMLNETLVRTNPEGGDELQPALAESWETSPNGTIYTFHLRPGLKFSDGTPLTTEDVTWSLERWADPEKDPSGSFLAVGFKSAKTIAPNTVQVKLSEPIPAFLYNVAITPASILPQKQVEEQGDAFWKNPVGAGAFKFKEFVTGNHITMDRNPYYWEKGRPYLDSVRFDFATESNSRVLALKSGQAQIADGIPYTQIKPLQGDSSVAVQEVEVPNWIFLVLNNTYKPLHDLNVRTAMQYIMDREQINQAIFKGIGSIPNGLFAPMKYWDKSIKPYEYDVDKAKEYMAKSSYPEGFSMTLEYPSGFEFMKQLTLLLQQEYGEIGIKVKLKEVPASAAFENWLNLKYQAIFQGPSVSSDIPVPDEYAGWFSDASGETRGFFTGWVNPEIRSKVHTFQRTVSESGRQQQWSVLQQEFKEQSPSLNILNMPFVNAHAANVCGTAVNALGVDELQNTWISQANKG